MNNQYQNTAPQKAGFLSNDLVFCEVMRRGDICRRFLESLLGIQVKDLRFPEKQKDLKDARETHGARLDIFVMDAAGNAYNVEMQNDAVNCLEKRARFYSSAIDRETLRPGEKYTALRNNIVIFICNYDGFGLELAEYAVEKSLVGPGTDVRVPYNDGAQILYLNTKYRIKNANAEITDFLDILRGESAATDFGKTVTACIDEVMKDKEVQRQMLTMEMRLDDERWRGEQEGIKKGMQQGKSLADTRTAQKLLGLGWEKEKIAAFLEITPEQLEALLSLPAEN